MEDEDQEVIPEASGLLIGSPTSLRTRELRGTPETEGTFRLQRDIEPEGAIGDFEAEAETDETDEDTRMHSKWQRVGSPAASPAVSPRHGLPNAMASPGHSQPISDLQRELEALRAEYPARKGSRGLDPWSPLHPRLGMQPQDSRRAAMAISTQLQSKLKKQLETKIGRKTTVQAMIDGAQGAGEEEDEEETPKQKALEALARSMEKAKLSVKKPMDAKQTMAALD